MGVKLCYSCGRPKGKPRWWGDKICECRNTRKGRKVMDPEKKKRVAAWSWKIPSWLEFMIPIFLKMVEPVLEKYLTKIQDKATKYLTEKINPAAGEMFKEGFWEIVDQVDDEFGVELDDLTPDE